MGVFSDTIEPQSGTTLTIGASGDTINIASGATITDFTSTGIDDNATSTAITIGSNENIGIGTTNSTTAKVYINHEGDVDDNGLYVYSNIGQTVPLVKVIQDGAGSTAPAVYIRNDDADGIALDIEASSPTARLISTVTNGVNTILFGHSDDADAGAIKYWGSAAGLGTFANAMTFNTNGTQRMHIDSSGRVGIGTTSPQVSSIISTQGASNGLHHHYFFNAAGVGVGRITCTASTTSYVTSSDYRLKENVSYDFDATTRLKQLKPARFNFIEDADKTVDGFLAHEVSDIVPEAISGTKDETETKEKAVVNANGKVIAENIEQADWEAGKIADDDGNTKYPTDSTWEATKLVPVYQGIDQAKLVPLLVKTIQELEARITALENA